MGKKVKRSYEHYRAALLGTQDREGELSPGLRRVAVGFKASEGYNLKELKAGNWTPSMKARVTKYLKELHELTAQEKIVVHTRSKARLEYAQRIGGHPPGFKFKVAFVPGSSKAKVEWNDDGTMTVREPGFSKLSAPFDREALAKNVAAEVSRVLNLPHMKKAETFGILTGANVMLGAMPDRKLLTAKVRALMEKYDGRKAIPQSSGNRGDKPSAHHWRQWLHGVQGYAFGKIDPEKRRAKLASMRRANNELQRRRANERARLKAAAKRKGC